MGDFHFPSGIADSFRSAVLLNWAKYYQSAGEQIKFNFFVEQQQAATPFSES